MEQEYSVSADTVSKDTMEDEFFRSLGEDYSCIIQVNLPENRVEALRFHPSVQRKYGSFVHETGNYRQMLAEYVQRHADPAERAQLLYALSPEHLGKYLESHKALLCQCHETKQDTRLCHRIKAALLENSRTQAVLGIVYGLDAGEAHECTLPRANRLLVVGEPELAEMLRPGYQVDEAATAEAAGAMLKRGDADYAAVVTCRNAGLLQAIRADTRCCLMPVIVAAEPGTESQCLAEGASELLVKPYHPDVVRNRVRSLISLLDYTAMVRVLERDLLTGMYTKEFFSRMPSSFAGKIRRKNIFWPASALITTAPLRKNTGNICGIPWWNTVPGRLKSGCPVWPLPAGSARKRLLSCAMISRRRSGTGCSTGCATRHRCPIW